jgi:hypothetical protein
MTLQVCVPGANGCTFAFSLDCSIGMNCERLPPAACGDPNWAEWPMPNTEPGTPNQASYTIGNDGATVTDNITGLMWERYVPSTTYLWTDAGRACPGRTTGGYSDWRLPTLVELISIADHTRTFPSIDISTFPSTPSAYFWCACSMGGGEVGFHIGNGGCGVDALSHDYIRCVR